ncbi:MAG: hypothetical protein O7A03_02790, partial [Alphaproteobacteria bacterium]|nr:hypothetical protein [Alphaproteobacteria bacterium]
MGFASVPDTAAQVAFVRPLTASSSRSDTSPQSAASSLRSYNGRQPAASQFDKVLAVQRLLIANGFGIDGVDGVLEEIAGVLTVETANA